MVCILSNLLKVTAYTACKRANVKPGQWIVLPGAGGGLGHFAVQYAKAMGMRVIAIDGGDAKRDLCKKLGAEQYIDFQQTKDIPAEVMKITGFGAHGVIVTAATKQAYESAPAMLRPNGTVVAVGLPKDPTVIAGAPPIMVVSQVQDSISISETKLICSSLRSLGYETSEHRRLCSR